MYRERTKGKYSLFNKAGLPMKYIDYEIEDFNILGNGKEAKLNQQSFKKFQNYMDNLEENMKAGKGLYICGPKGVGKTMLMTILAKEVIKILKEWNKDIKEMYGRSCDSEKLEKLHFIQSTSLMQLAFRGTCSPAEKELSYRIKDLAGLMVDDITKISSYSNNMEFSVLDDIFRYRDLQGLPTWITAQMDLEDLEQQFGGPLIDMLRGNMEEIIFVGNSQRSESNG